MHARLQANVLRSVPRTRVHIGAAPLENAQRAAYQSARCRDGYVAPLPLTLAEAWAEAERQEYAREQMQDHPIDFSHSYTELTGGF